VQRVKSKAFEMDLVNQVCPCALCCRTPVLRAHQSGHTSRLFSVLHFNDGHILLLLILFQYTVSTIPRWQGSQNSPLLLLGAVFPPSPGGCCQGRALQPSARRQRRARRAMLRRS